MQKKFLIVYNKYRNQWEFPAGKIELSESPKECARRELYEETNQMVDDLTFKGLFKIFDTEKNQVRYRTVYFGEIDKLVTFKENDEIKDIKLWNLKSDIGYFDEVDKMILQLCLSKH